MLQQVICGQLLK